MTFVKDAPFRTVPIYHDILDFDLEEPLHGFFEDVEDIWWGLVVSAIRGSLKEHVRVPGQDWEIRFWPAGELEIPSPSKRSRRTYSRKVRSDCALLGIRVGQVRLNEVRDRGRPSVRALLGLARREFSLLRANDVLWEGPYSYPRNGRMKMAVGLIDMEALQPIAPANVSLAGLRLAQISISKLPPQLFRALSWLALARSAKVRQEKFIHLWLALRALSDFNQPNKGHQMTRIERYTATMGHGVGGVISGDRITQLNDRIRAAYNLRTALLHHDDDTGITTESLADLEEIAFHLVDFEFAKLGFKVY